MEHKAAMWRTADAQSRRGDALAGAWLAVQRRDRGADGQFVYAVRSTRVYCRPSCPSRRPRRDGVAFYATPDAAEAAGYRPCRRCRPRDVSPEAEWARRVGEACAYIERSLGPVPLARLARRVGGSPYHLHRRFKAIVGVTPREYGEACRMQRVRRQLRRGAPVTAAITGAGFGSSSRFYERAAARLGMAPAAYGRGGAGMTIKYDIVDCSLGRLLVAATPRGVCAVMLGDSDAALRRDLAREYPAAVIEPDAGGALRAWTAAVLGAIDGAPDCAAPRPPRLTTGKAPGTGAAPEGGLPLDVQATAFQWRVWKALAAIPLGETRSYAEIAEAIGQRGAARAVARACATNPVAVAIPCHRAVPAAGGVGGYRWGSERKQAILAAERAGAGRSQ